MQDLLLLLNGRNKSIPAAARFSFSQSHYSVNGVIQTFSDLFTTTRASKAWDIVDGVLIEYANNTPVENSNGLAVFEANTNLITKSNNFAAAGSNWGDTGNFTQEDATSFGDSLGLTAYKQTNNNAATARAVKQTLGTLTANRETFTFIVENVDALETTIIVDDLTTVGQVMYMVFTWATESISFGTTTRGTSPIGTATKLAEVGPNGGQLFELSVSAIPVTAGNSRQVRLFYTGLSQNSLAVIAHHAQYCEQEYIAPTILTNGSTVTRNADVIVNNAAITSWYNDSEGTIYAKANTVDAASNNVFSSLGAATTDIHYSTFQSGTQARGITVSGGAAANLSTAYTKGNTANVAYAYKTNDFQLVKDGVAGVSDTSGTVPTGVDTLVIGDYITNAFPLNGYIQDFRYYSTRLPQADMITITG